MRPSIGEKTVDRLREFTEALERGEIITKRFRCKNVTLNLQPEPYDPALVKKTRSILGVSQSLFAQFLGVTTGAVQKWERGDNPPEDIACRFMDEIRFNPDYWRQRLIESAKVTA